MIGTKPVRPAGDGEKLVWEANPAMSRVMVRGLVLPCVMALLAWGCGDDDGGGNNNANGNGGGVCGDGVVDPEEQCDQGAANSDTAPDACRTDCREAYCGDEVVDTAESCDDGNAGGGDGCSASCEGEEGWDCSSGSCEPVCGDNRVVGEETCDGTDLRGESCVSIGQAAGDLGCDAQCEWDITDCTGTAVCGDGVQEGDEQCDDGNQDSCDGCSDACMVEACGNGRMECDETCDDGDGDNTDGCPDGPGGTCQVAVCGDGFVWSGHEACDDGNSDNMDGCLENCVEMLGVTLPAGSFDMGSASGQSDEEPVHTVMVPAFEMLETEVTVKQYAGCVDAGACTAPSTWYIDCNWNDPGFEDHPVNCVDWQQAVDFCTWAGGRLPTEAEWEYAARSGGPSSSYQYPWGNATATCSYAVMDDGNGPGCGTGTSRTWPVCSKTAGNTLQGLCDMAGNVLEWVQDWYHSDYTGAPTDGSAWLIPSGGDRVIRGGSKSYGAAYVRAAWRDDSADGGGSVGFRCARDAP